MLNKDLRTWLESGLPDLVFRAGPKQDEDETDAYILVTPLPGGPMTLEERAEQPSFQIRSIGEQSSGDNNDGLDTAEVNAFRVDRFILTAFRPVIGGVPAIRLFRAGGSPAPLEMDDADRTHVVCTYGVEIASGY